jgi:uncharacterized protein YndB with AHSA1/START domain
MDSDSVSVERVIPATPEAIFQLLANASEHPRFDGSGTLQSAEEAPGQLNLGSTFGMSMRTGLPYSMVNEVVEYEENRRIAWRPNVQGLLGRLAPGGRVWRYELAPADGGTRVRETWDISQDSMRWFFSRGRVPERTRQNMDQTLERIERLVTDSRDITT